MLVCFWQIPFKEKGGKNIKYLMPCLVVVVQVVAVLLYRLSSNDKQTDVINQQDNEGFCPLHWAVR